MVNNKYVRLLLFSAGILCALLGVVGAILPLVPATPFLLLAAVCFAKSSAKMYNLFINNKLFGKQLQNYRNKKGLSLLNKVIIIIFIWPSILFTVYYVPYPIVRIPILIIALFATTHVLNIKTKRKRD